MALFRRKKNSEAKLSRKDRKGRSPFFVGGVTLIVLALVTFLGFTKRIPFHHGFQVNAVFANANNLKPGFFVRIAGVNVGKVKKVQQYENTPYSMVTMEVQKKGLPIHKDAILKIRPRLFLEGNFFVDIQPGTPESPDLGSGDTIPMTQTAAPVQFGDVLTALQKDDRRNLQKTLTGIGSALLRPPDASDDVTADPATKGETAAKSLHDASVYGGPALRDSSIVNQALLGQRPQDDMRTIIRSLGRISVALDRNESQLQDLVVNFNTTMKAFADESAPLRASIRVLGPTLQVANTTLADLNASFPPTRRLALALIPGTRETGPTIDAALPWIRQTRALLQPTELRGLVNELSPATADLSRTIDATVKLLPQQNLLSKCLSQVILPVGDVKIPNEGLQGYKPVENYKEFWYTLVGLAGETQTFDGNGGETRVQALAGGRESVSLGDQGAPNLILGGSPSRAQANPAGSIPAYPGVRPPYKPFVPCYTNQASRIRDKIVHAKMGPADGKEGGGGSTSSSSTRGGGR